MRSLASRRIAFLAISDHRNCRNKNQISFLTEKQQSNFETRAREMGAVTLQEAKVAIDGGLERDFGVRELGDRSHRGGLGESWKVPGRVRGLGFWF
jgi:hypothetical protein